MKTYLLKLLHKNCKPMMQWYYRTFYGNDMRKVLGWLMDYDGTGGGLDIRLICSIVADTEDWTDEYSVRIFSYCVYCEFVETA